METGQHHTARSDPEALQRFRAYHDIVVAFAIDALGGMPLDDLLQRATEQVSVGINVRRAKVLEYRPGTNDLLVRAGVGWEDGVVGHAALPTDMASPPGRTWRLRQPTYIDDLPRSSEFKQSGLLRQHDIISLINVPIEIDGQTWGVLEVDSSKPRHFNSDDAAFLCGFALVMGKAIENQRRRSADKAAHLQQKVALRERELIFRELQHRIANNFQAITGFLDVARRRVSDPTAQEQLEQIIDRVVKIHFAHQQLDLAKVEQDVHLKNYLGDLASSIRGPENVRFIQKIQDATAPLTVAVRLGFILNELVTNVVKHAFDDAGGTVTISLVPDLAAGTARLTVKDDGRGLPETGKQGYGVGLIASFAQQIGGTVLRRSRPNDGTEVTITFPLTADAPEA